MWVLLAAPPACQPRQVQGRVCTVPTPPPANFPTKPWTHLVMPGLFQWLPPVLCPISSSPGTYRATLGLLAPVEWTITPFGTMVRPVLKQSFWVRNC